MQAPALDKPAPKVPLRIIGQSSLAGLGDGFLVAANDDSPGSFVSQVAHNSKSKENKCRELKISKQCTYSLCSLTGYAQSSLSLA